MAAEHDYLKIWTFILFRDKTNPLLGVKCIFCIHDDQEYAIPKEDGNKHFIYIDFPAGKYLSGAMAVDVYNPYRVVSIDHYLFAIDQSGFEPMVKHAAGMIKSFMIKGLKYAWVNQDCNYPDIENRYPEIFPMWMNIRNAIHDLVTPDSFQQSILCEVCAGHDNSRSRCY